LLNEDSKRIEQEKEQIGKNMKEIDERRKNLRK